MEANIINEEMEGGGRGDSFIVLKAYLRQIFTVLKAFQRQSLIVLKAYLRQSYSAQSLPETEL